MKPNTRSEPVLSRLPSPQHEAEPARPGSVSLRGLTRAATNLLRIAGLAALAVCFFVLWFFNPSFGRSVLVGIPIAILLLLTRLRKDFFVWALYIVGFLVFVDLRMISAEAIFPARFEYVILLEKVLFLGTIPTIWLQQRLYTFGAPTPLDLALIGVHFSFFLMPHAVAGILWGVDRSLFRRYVTALIATCYFGLVVAFLVPTAPPWLAGMEGHVDPVFRIMRDVMANLTPETYETAYRAVGENAAAAMPSLHTALTLLVALATAAAFPRLRYFVWIYFAAMVFALVYLGEHYVVDIVAGMVAGWAFWWMAGRSLKTEVAG